MEQSDSAKAAKDAKTYTLQKLILAGTAVAVLAIMALSTDTHAAPTQVQSTVCNESIPVTKTLVITEPEGDSVTDKLFIDLRGTVENVGQLEVYINDTIDHALSLPAGAKSFSTTVQLTPGTSSIKVIGYLYSSCRIEPLEDTAVITYLPSSPKKEKDPKPTNGGGSAAATGTSENLGVGGPGTDAASLWPGNILPGVDIPSPLGHAIAALHLESFRDSSSVINSILFAVGVVMSGVIPFIKRIPRLYGRASIAVGVVFIMLALVLS